MQTSAGAAFLALEVSLVNPGSRNDGSSNISHVRGAECEPAAGALGGSALGEHVADAVHTTKYMHVEMNGGVIVARPDAGDRARWEIDAARFLTIAIGMRPVTLAVIEERSSVDWEEALHTKLAGRARAGGLEFSLYHVPRATTPLFASIVATPDFFWDGVWFVPGNAHEATFDRIAIRETLSAFVRIEGEAERSLRAEMLVPSADGYAISWYEPRLRSKNFTTD